MIPRSKIDEIFQATSIEEVIGDFVQLKRSGSNLSGLSPFTDERTPSFMVSPSKQIFKDFSSGKGGNVVNFLMEHEQMTYPEALRYLADKYNIEIQETEASDEEKQEQSLRESLYVVTSFAERSFMEELHNSDEGRSVGLNYFLERGFTQAIIERFRVGYAPDSWNHFLNKAKKEGHKLDYLEKAGLIRSKGERHYDFFRGRVIFPIHNLTGRPVAFGGRILRKDSNAPKYLNSPESPIYDKSRTLYGLYFAKKPISNNDNCYLVEGYTDVLALHQAGVENTVATAGTSLTREHIKLIRRYTRNVTILFDGDRAGIEASFRSIDMFLEEEMAIKVVLFPEGEDPDTYSKRVSSEELQTFLSENAQDFITYKAGLLADKTRNDPTERAKMIHEIVGSIALIPDHVLRSLYIKECSEVLAMEEEALISEVNKVRRKRFHKEKKRQSQRPPEEVEAEEAQLEQSADGKRSAQLQTGSEDSWYHYEQEVVRLLLLHGDKELRFQVYRGDEESAEEGRDTPNEVDLRVADRIVNELDKDEIEFQTPAHRTVYEEFRKAVQAGAELPDQGTFCGHSNESIRNLATSLIESPYELSHKWEERYSIFTTTEEMQLKYAVNHAIYSLKLWKVTEMIEGLRERMRQCEREEESIQLMAEQKQLEEAKRFFSKEMGRKVLK